MTVKSILLLLLLAATHVVVKATLNRPAGPVLKEQGISPPPADLKVNVACYYYPWHADDFHRDEEYLRDYLVPRQEPSLGEYDDRDPEVIKAHLRMSRQANCRVWVAAWFGIGSREDTTLLQNTLPTLLLNDVDQRVAIHYETNALVRTRVTDNQGVENIFYTLDGKPSRANDGVADHMKHFCQNYFNHPNYYFVQGNRPVIFLYLSRTLDNVQNGIDEQGNRFTWEVNELLAAVVETMRTAAIAQCGMNPYIVGDHIFNAFNQIRDTPALQILDAINGYDVYGHLDDNGNGYAGDEIAAFYGEQLVWKNAANANNCAYIPSLTPGFNDRAVRLRKKSDGSEAMSLSRKLNSGMLEGSFFAKSIELALPLLDEGADYLIALTSFNEIHEDSQIEPMVVDKLSRALVIAADGTQTELDALKVTKLAYRIWNEARDGYLDPSAYLGPDEDLTQGLDYEAYYDLYLNILRATTLAPFYDEDFETDPINGALDFGALVIPEDPINAEGSRSLELVRNDSDNAPRFRINLGSLEYNFLVIEFMFYSERSEANELLVARCLDEVGGLATEISSEKWEFGREYKEHRKSFYAVTECNIRNVANNHNVVVEIAYESLDERTSILIDSIKVTGLRQPTNGSPALLPTASPTKGLTPLPTPSPTKIPTKSPTPLPTPSPTKIPTKSPTPLPTQSPTKKPTGPTVIFPRQDFESGLGSIWRESTGTDADDSERVRYSDQSLPSNNASTGGGTWCIRLRDRPTTGSSIFTGGINVNGFSKLSLEFDYFVDSYEDNDDFLVQWKIANVAGFYTEQQFIYKANGSGVVLRQWKRAAVEFDNWVTQGRPRVIDLRIISHATANDDRVFIDNIVFYGIA